MNNFSIGKVSFVKGTLVKAIVKPHLNKITYVYDGRLYRGVAINEHIIIRKGFFDLVGKVEGEEIQEIKSITQEIPADAKFNRYVEIRVIGYLKGGVFYQGIKYLPMIGDGLFLINTDQLEKIYNFGNQEKPLLSGHSGDKNESIYLGKTVLENQSVSIPIDSIFASHIGIFGNTGSGKSNTLAKLYVSLFEQKKCDFQGKSTFLLIDFNGEYENIYSSFTKEVDYLKLNTHKYSGEDKLKISNYAFWDDELLSILYSATEKTQKPFLSHLVKNKKRSQIYGDEKKLTNYYLQTLERAFGGNQHKEVFNLFYRLLEEVDTGEAFNIIERLKDYSIEWYVGNPPQNKYTLKDSLGNWHFIDSAGKLIDLIPEISQLDIDNIVLKDPFKEVIIRALLQLINSTAQNFIQYEYISPLIAKMTAMQNDLKKVIYIDADEENNEKVFDKAIQIISLRDCNTQTKKIIAMLLAKTSFHNHKQSINNKPPRSFHFIIDEAHNILSEESSRETSLWKDYRLELFEEIIKEGRKFGFFVTLASQRPADISPTIISQLHNYFLHRLVNENDLNLLKNAISTLDNASRSLIPVLPPGACVVSGVAFHTPVVVQIDKLIKEKAPSSETLSLIKLWG